MKKTIIILSVLVLVYGGLGFWLAPRLVKPRLMTALTEQLHRRVDLHDLSINPFTLSLTAEGLAVYDPDGQKAVGFKELYINVQLSSILRRALTFSEIVLDSPAVNLRIMPDGKLNFTDLAAPKESETPPATDKGVFPVYVMEFRTENGRVEFQDLARAAPYRKTLFPLNFELTEFYTRPGRDNRIRLAATTDGDARISWDGTISVAPLGSNGKIELKGYPLRNAWEYFQDDLKAEILSGTLDAAGQYDVNLAQHPAHIQIAGLDLHLSDFDLAEKGSQTRVLHLSDLSVTGVAVDLAEKEARVTDTTIKEGRLDIQRMPDGSLNIQNLLATPQGENAEAEKAPAPASPQDPWTFGIAALKLENFNVAFEDRTVEPAAHLLLTPMDLNMIDLSNEKDHLGTLKFKTGINQAGTVALDGEVGINPVAVSLKINAGDVALAPFQEFLSPLVRLTLTDGAASLAGRLNYGKSDADGPQLHFSGDTRIDGFKAAPASQSEGFLQWKRLAFNGLSFNMDPDKLEIGEILLDSPDVRVRVRPDKTMNLSDIAVKKETEQLEEAPPSPAKASMPITIDTVRLVDAAARFEDQSITPDFTIGIQLLNGTVQGLSSEAWTKAQVDLAGMIDAYAPVRITGQINPLSSEAFTDMTATAKNIEMVAFSPYTGKYAGYKIEKGKLSLDVRTRLSKSELQGDNKIFMDQFAFGEAVDSPDATSLPVTLAVGLLQTRDGKINIDLPVKGNINDPDFSYGKLVLDALVNLLEKAATSPFAAIGDLVGLSGETLGYVAFAPGSRELSPDQADKLAKLAEALAQRPALRIEISGTADPDADRSALKTARLLDQIRALKTVQLKKAGKPLPADPKAFTFEDPDMQLLTLAAYQKQFGQPPTPKEKGATSKETVAFARKRMEETISVTDEDLATLAKERGQAIKAQFIDVQKIPDDRVFLRGAEVTSSAVDAEVRSPLTLTAD